MSNIRPFRALRPVPSMVSEISAPPYDVVTRSEVRELIRNNPKSLLNISRSDALFDDSVSAYDSKIYGKANELFQEFIRRQWLVRDAKPAFYLYSQSVGGFEQTGIVCAASVEEYDADKIKKHEKTREEKEIDRTTHIDTLNANLEPIFLFHERNSELKSIFAEIRSSSEPVYNFLSEDDGVRHQFWPVFNEEIIRKIQSVYNRFDYLYIADGHHRAASAARVSRLRKKNNPSHTGNEDYNFVLSVVFPADELRILPYHRVLKDSNGLDEKAFMAKLNKYFEVKRLDKKVSPAPARKRDFSLYYKGDWYCLTPKSEFLKNLDVIAALDVSILQNLFLGPVLGIKDPRTDKRIDFVGGSHPLSRLEEWVNSGDFEMAFAMYATSIDELKDVADAGCLMPPKSTWFFPKLRSGLFIYPL